MRKNKLGLMSVAGSLALASAAGADFTGLAVTSQTLMSNGGTAYDVFELYATFDSPGDSAEAVAVGGTPDFRQTLAAGPGGFFQVTIFGAQQNLPNGEGTSMVPNIALDSFVTIGVRQLYAGTPALPAIQFFNTTDFNNGSEVVTTVNGGWFVAPGSPEAAAVPYPPPLPAEATFTLPAGATHGTILGQFTVAEGNTFSGDLGQLAVFEAGVARIVDRNDPPGLNAMFSFSRSGIGGGACCQGDGSCTEVADEAECTAAGGTYQGDGSTCAPNPCMAAPGACCQIDGSCAEQPDAAACTATGGTFQGAGTTCSPNPCVASPGACCQTDGSCTEEADAGACTAAGGTFQGAGTTCTPNPCTADPGACCQLDGSCSEQADAGACAGIGGTFQGAGTTCSPNPCVAAPGACCQIDGSCAEQPNEGACSETGGTFQGHGTTCSPNPCIAAPGACCQIDGSCAEQADAAACTATGGTFQGAGTSCTPNPCVAAPGACCQIDGSCAEQADAAACTATGGTFQGAGTTCTPNPCVAAPGACCQLDGSCAEQADAAACTATGGSFQGPGTSCSPNPCTASPGACCQIDGSCAEQPDAAACTATGGTFQGAGTTCTPNPCVAEPGACCQPDGACAPAADAAACEATGGTFQGAGTSCSPNPCPTCQIDASINPPEPMVCAGESVQVCAQSINGTPPLTYLWSTGETTSCINVDAGGQISVTITDAEGCEGIAFATVSERDLPVIAPDVITICDGETVPTQLCSNPSGGTPPYMFFWSTGATSECTDIPGPGTYSVQVTDANGCVVVGEASLTVLPSPVVTPDSAATCGTAGSAELCSNPSGGTPPYAFAWTGPGGFSATAECINATIAGTYEVIVTDANGCTGTGSGSLILFPEPTVMASDIAACESAGASEICAIASGGTVPYTYAWAGPDGFTADTECISVSVAGEYLVIVTDADGCTDEATATYTIHPDPSVVVTGSDICGAGSSELCANASGGTPPYTYLWSTGATTECIDVAGPDTYSVTVTDANGCTADGEFSVAVLALPVCDLTVPSPVPACGSTGNMLGVFAVGADPLTFEWSVTGPAGWIITSGDDTPNITYSTGAGVAAFSVQITDGNGCSTACSISFACESVDSGACCDFNGTCTDVVNEGACDAMGGIFQGTGSTCASTTCEVEDPFAVGACCLSGGNCWQTNFISCIGSGGAWQGQGSSCTAFVCPVASGACCFASGCFQLPQAQCLGNGGEYRGDNTLCDACTPITGACCLEDGSCQDVTLLECNGIAGANYEGDNTTCAATACPPPVPTGACCYAGAICSDIGAGACASTGGTYLGDDTDCISTTCPNLPPVGVCCYTGGTCGYSFQSNCILTGGTWLGVGSNCLTDPCPEPTGACCLGSQCIVVTSLDCLISGGTYQGSGTNCASTSQCAVLLTPVVSNTAGGHLLGAMTGSLTGDDATDDGLDIVLLFEGKVQMLANAGVDADGKWRGFSAQPATVVGEGVAAMTLAKLDDDDHVDIALADPTSNAIHVYRNDGDGTFVPHSTISDALLGAPFRVIAAEFTGDGADDLLVASESSGRLVLLVNDGDGHISSLEMLADTYDSLLDLTASDLDGDGVSDVVASIANDGATSEVHIIYNDGFGNFEVPVVRELPNMSKHLSLTDLDLDGNADILVTGSGAMGTLSLIRNGDDAPFGGAEVYTMDAHDARGLAAGDVTGDGTSDAVVARTNVTTTMLEGAPAHVTLIPGAPTTSAFEPSSAVNMLAPSVWVSAVDVNGDGRSDVLSVTETGLIVTRLSSPAIEPSDCNGNDVPDWIDIATMSSTDCNTNDVPDACEDMSGPRRSDHSCLCPADLDGNGSVDGADIAVAMMSIGACGGISCPADLDGNGVVNTRDLEAVMAAIGPCIDSGPSMGGSSR